VRSKADGSQFIYGEERENKTITEQNVKNVKSFPINPGGRMGQRLSLFLYRARQLYKNISMLFLFPVKDCKLSTGVNAAFNASCYG